MKKCIKVFILIVLLISLTACGPKYKGKCRALDCLKKMDSSVTLEQANKVMGFDGEKKDEKSNTYTWEIREGEKIEIAFSTSNATVKATVNREEYANKKVDFSKYEELRKKINTGIEYDEFITYVGNVDGIVIEKGPVTTKYLWVSKDGSYLNASFSNTSNKCTFASGKVK